jgi:hypothetical protein
VANSHLYFLPHGSLRNNTATILDDDETLGSILENSNLFSTHQNLSIEFKFVPKGGMATFKRRGSRAGSQEGDFTAFRNAAVAVELINNANNMEGGGGVTVSKSSGREKAERPGSMAVSGPKFVREGPAALLTGHLWKRGKLNKEYKIRYMELQKDSLNYYKGDPPNHQLIRKIVFGNTGSNPASKSTPEISDAPSSGKFNLSSFKQKSQMFNRKSSKSNLFASSKSLESKPAFVQHDIVCEQDCGPSKQKGVPDFTFSLKVKNRSFMFAARTAENRREWLEHLQRILKVRSQVNTHAILAALPRSSGQCIDRTVEEIVESERLYVSDLKLMMDEYVKPLLAALAYQSQRQQPKRFSMRPKGRTKTKSMGGTEALQILEGNRDVLDDISLNLDDALLEASSPRGDGGGGGVSSAHQSDTSLGTNHSMESYAEEEPSAKISQFQHEIIRRTVLNYLLSRFPSKLDMVDRISTEVREHILQKRPTKEVNTPLTITAKNLEQKVMAVLVSKFRGKREESLDFDSEFVRSIYLNCAALLAFHDKFLDVLSQQVDERLTAVCEAWEKRQEAEATAHKQQKTLPRLPPSSADKAKGLVRNASSGDVYPGTHTADQNMSISARSFESLPTTSGVGAAHDGGGSENGDSSSSSRGLMGFLKWKSGRAVSMDGALSSVVSVEEVPTKDNEGMLAPESVAVPATQDGGGGSGGGGGNGPGEKEGDRKAGGGGIETSDKEDDDTAVAGAKEAVEANAKAKQEADEVELSRMRDEALIDAVTAAFEEHSPYLRMYVSYSLYWNILTDCIFCTGISLLTEYFVLEYPY